MYCNYMVIIGLSAFASDMLLIYRIVYMNADDLKVTKFPNMEFSSIRKRNGL